MQEMAARLGCDISLPARTAREAVQWLYFAYPAAVKSQNGGAMSLGRITTFLDIYIERDLRAGLLNEEQAQGSPDHFIMNALVRFLHPEFDSLFSGDPIWATEVLGGMGLDAPVSKPPSAICILCIPWARRRSRSLTVLWSQALPAAPRKYAARVSIATSSRSMNDDLMRSDFQRRPRHRLLRQPDGDRNGKQMQFFGARANLAKRCSTRLTAGWMRN